jgi:hypothetical protein
MQQGKYCLIKLLGVFSIDYTIYHHHGDYKQDESRKARKNNSYKITLTFLHLVRVLFGIGPTLHAKVLSIISTVSPNTCVVLPIRWVNCKSLASRIFLRYIPASYPCFQFHHSCFQCIRPRCTLAPIVNVPVTSAWIWLPFLSCTDCKLAST